MSLRTVLIPCVFSFLLIPFSQIACFAQKQAAAEPPVLTAEQVANVLHQPNGGYSAHYEAGRFYESKGLLEQAKEEYKLAVADKGAQANGFKRLAQVSLQLQDSTLAESVITKAAKLYPKDYGVHLTAGFVLHNEKKLPEALAMYKEAMAIRPDSPDIYLATADVLIDLKRAKEALPLVQHSMTIAKPSSFAYFEEAKVLLALGRPNDALVPLAKNFQLDPFNFASNQLYVAILQQQGNFEQALETSLCLLTVTSGKSMDDIKTMIGGLIPNLPAAKINAVIKRAEDKITDKKNKAIMRFALGDAYDRLAHRDEAISQYKAGLAINPLFARGYLRLGEDLEDAKSDLKGASEDYEKAYALDHNDREINKRRQKLKLRMQSPGTTKTR